MRVSVVLATYNGEKYIAELLESLIAQTYHDFRIFIHDDGSSDHTVEICESYKNSYPDRVSLLGGNPTGGAKNNFFFLLEEVESDYVFFCDQDDIWLPQKIENMLKIAEQEREEGNGLLVYSDLKVVDENLNVKSESFYQLTHVDPHSINYKNVLVKGYIPGCVMMINNHLKKDMLCYGDLKSIKMHDWWAMIVAFQTKAKIIFINDPLVLYRQHSNNTIGAKNLGMLDRIAFNVKRIINGSIATEKRKNIESPRAQAAQVEYISSLDMNARKFAMDFAGLGKKSKIQRMIFYTKNFQRVYRLWWMLLWV